VLHDAPALDRRHRNGRTTKRRQEIPGGVAASYPANTPVIVRELPTRHVVLDGKIRNLPFGPIQYGKQCTIAAINILAKFEFALIIDESSLVSQVDWDEGRKLDVGLVGAIHPMDAVLSVTFTWSHYRQQHLGIFHGILYSHAAVAFGTPIIGEKLFLVRVVLVDQKLVGKVEWCHLGCNLRSIPFAAILSDPAAAKVDIPWRRSSRARSKSD